MNVGMSAIQYGISLTAFAARPLLKLGTALLAGYLRDARSAQLHTQVQTQLAKSYAKDFVARCRVLDLSNVHGYIRTLTSFEYAKKCFDVCSETFGAIKSIPYFSPNGGAFYNNHSIICDGHTLAHSFPSEAFAANYLRIMGPEETILPETCRPACLVSFLSLNSEHLNDLVSDKLASENSPTPTSLMPALLLATTVDIIAQEAGLKGSLTKDALRAALGAIAAGCAATATGVVATEGLAIMLGCEVAFMLGELGYRSLFGKQKTKAQ